DEDAVLAILSEIEDRLGRKPREVEILGELMIWKGWARRLGALAIDVSDGRLTLALPGETQEARREPRTLPGPAGAGGTPLDPQKVMQLISRKKSRWRLLPDMRLVRTLGEDERQDPLRGYRAALQEILSCATPQA